MRPMEQERRLDDLLDYLSGEYPEGEISIPADYKEKRALYRSLVNIRPPRPVPEQFIVVQNTFLQEEARQKGVVQWEDIPPCPHDDKLRLWQGDITRLKVDAIVNAANSQLLGCFIPCHGCIDNAIHTAAGIQLREACHEMMRRQGRDEATGSAKITEAFNLPANYVIHTVGPVVQGGLQAKDCDLLASCYRSCLEIARNLDSIAFCCISTGEFRFPRQEAAEIAIKTVREYLGSHNPLLQKIIFNVFTDADYEIYMDLLH